MNRYLLDSDVVIWVLRGNWAVVDRVEQLAGRGRLLVSSLTRAEVWSGARPEEEARTARLLDALGTVPVSGAIADKAGEMRRVHARRGITLHLPDAIIAATSLDAEAPLHTCNARHYAAIDGLATVALEI